MQRRIIVLGSINEDLIVAAEHLPVPGETVPGSAFTRSLGGKGANQAIAAAKAGAAVSMIGAVGSDDGAAAMVANLAEHGVGTERVRRVPGPSGVALITVDSAAENTIVVVPGANGQLQALDEADRAALEEADLLLMQLEVPLATVVAGAQVAHAAGVAVLLNPAPVYALPDDLLDALTIVIVNQTEARAIGAALQRVPHLVTTLGADGARYRGPQESFTVAAVPVTAVDTVGAGDAFIGAFAQAWAAGASARTAVQRGCAAGALAASRPGANVSSPVRDEIDALVAKAYG